MLSNRKRLNALKHGTEIYERRREELKMEYRRMKPEHSVAPPGVRTLKKEENAMVVTSLIQKQKSVIASEFLFIWFSFVIRCAGQRSQWAMIRVCLQNLRVLENSLEKSQFKCKEAENIMIDYLKLKSHLQVSPAFLVKRKTLSAPSPVTVCVIYFWNSHCKAGLWKWLFWSLLSALILF